MSKILYEALSKIPNPFIDDKTDHCQFGNKILIVHPDYEPMIYSPETKVWAKLNIAEDST